MNIRVLDGILMRALDEVAHDGETAVFEAGDARAVVVGAAVLRRADSLLGEEALRRPGSAAVVAFSDL